MSLRSCLHIIGLLFIILNDFESVAQTTQVTRPFELTYSRNLRGGVISFGNTSMHAVQNGAPDLNIMNESGDPGNLFGGMGNSQYGNDFSDMKVIDIDGDINTQNSSSADLSLPAGVNTIKLGRIYWSGRVDLSIVNAVPDTLRKIKIRTGSSGNYLTLTASEVLSVLSTDGTSVTYQSYADITNFVQVNGSGTYMVADIPISERHVQGGQYGGWAITVVYENPAFPYYSIRVYDGFATVYNGGNIGTLGFTLNGLNLPGRDVELQDAIMGVVAWEGDANLPGDYIQINGNFVQNSRNPATNFFNGSITKYDTYISSKNPDYYNQLGIDIDELYVGEGYGIQPNATSIDILLGTERDQYFPGIFTFSVRVKDPTLVINKSVYDQNGNNYADPSEELTFTLAGGNVGRGNAYYTTITDTLPYNVTYVPGSFEVLSVPGGSVGNKTDASQDDEFVVETSDGKTYLRWNVGIGADATRGGELPVDSMYLARFKVRALSQPSNIINLAQIAGESLAGELFTDESSASIYVNFGSGNPETHVACDSFYWKGNWYTAGGTYKYDYINTAGLSATDTLYLTIKKSTSSRFLASICSSELPYEWSGLSFNEAGTKTLRLVNAEGCDSIVTLELIVKTPSESFTTLSICPDLLPYSWNQLIFTEAGTQTATLTNAGGCDSLATLTLTVINCDPPCYTENFNTDPSGWKLSRGAQIRDYENPINNCRTDRGIQTPGVGGFDPAIIQTPQYTSSGAKRIKLSFDLFPFDANMRCNSWKDYNCPVSIDVYYYVGSTKYVGVIDYVLPRNGPGGSPNVSLVISVFPDLPEGTKYSIEIVFKKKNGVGNCVQQNTKYIIDNFSVCELQCAICPIPAAFIAGNFVSANIRSQNITIWPNPASHRINVMINNMAPARVELLDVLGKQVLGVVNQASINVSQLKAGIYIAKIYKSNAEIESRQIQVIK